MRIVIDMQGAQTESRFRGIGRYSLSLAKAIAKNNAGHEVILALNGQFPETIEPIRAEFKELLPKGSIRVWHALEPTRDCDTNNSVRRNTAELLREAFILSLRPNVILITSLFEGFGDNAVTSIGRFDSLTPTVTILYDLIPLISPDINFRENPVHIGYYSRKLSSLKNSAALLAISESSRNEALNALKFNSEFVINISSGCDKRFKRLNIADHEREIVLKKFGISRKFFLYTGGADERKNLPRLIHAFAALPNDLRISTQLLLVGKMPVECVENLIQESCKAGLCGDEIIFGGYVSDFELMQLYGLCVAFVFPSLHEGFGLPPLEAMACGAPVITSNVTSLPEVVGREDAMFNPLSVFSISEKMEQILSDENFRTSLINYGVKRVKEFSWDKCAVLAITMMERVAKPAKIRTQLKNKLQESQTGIFRPNKKRILVSKLDHMGDLTLAVPAIMKLKARYPYADIDAIVGSWNREQAESLGVFNRVYVFDFFSKKSAESAVTNEIALSKIVDLMPYYDFAIDFRRQRDTRIILLKVPAEIYVAYATGEVSIDSRLNICIPGSDDIPFVTTDLNKISISKQMICLIDALPFEINDYIKLPINNYPKPIGKARIAIFPKAGNDVKEWGLENFCELIKLLVESTEMEAVTVYVTNTVDASHFSKIFGNKINVCVNAPYHELLASLSNHTICLANNSFGAHIASFIGLKVLAIYAGHETVTEWAPIFGDALVIHNKVECSPCHIAQRSDCNNDFKCMHGISPDYIFSTISKMSQYASDHNGIQSIDELISDLLEAVAKQNYVFTDFESLNISECIARNILENRKCRLFVDVSELAVKDAKTGIQRVTRSILKCLLDDPPAEYEIIPVVATSAEVGYRVDNRFVHNIDGFGMGINTNNSLIDFQSGDVFIGLDLQQRVVSGQRDFYRQMRHNGVDVYFVVYDLLPISNPELFPLGTEQAHTEWLDVVMENSGALCISKSVAKEVNVRFSMRNCDFITEFDIKYFHLGSDIGNSIPTFGVPSDADLVLEKLSSRHSFITVGTIEPRKGYVQVLASFEQLWESGEDINLVIVGKQGWNMESFVECLLKHPEYGNRLFWLEGISDEYLEKLYDACTCLIAASFGEGFGLPLIEAAQRGLPIIARDIPIFREVSGEYAFYFEAQQAEYFSIAIKKWIDLYSRNNHPKSSGMPFLSWNQSAKMLISCLT